MAREIVKELENSLGLGKPEEVAPPLDSLTYFQRRTYEIVRGLTYNEREFTDYKIWKKAEDLFPYVEYVTAPRSISEFQEVKRAILEIGHQSNYTGSLHDNLTYLMILADDFKIFLADTAGFQTGPEEYWKNSEGVYPGELKTINPQEKILSLDKILELDEMQNITDRYRVGATFGKWRLVLHSEHRQLLREAKMSMGGKSTMLAFVEGKKSVKLRRGSDHYCSDDDERLLQVADEPWVDYVCLLDPRERSEESLDRYYRGVWEKIGLNYCFVGERKYHLNEHFAERGKKTGTILLWDREENKVSTTEVIDQITSVL